MEQWSDSTIVIKVVSQKWEYAQERHSNFQNRKVLLSRRACAEEEIDI